MSVKPKRPPRQVWGLFDEFTEGVSEFFLTKKDAKDATRDGERVVGPYVLAERARER